LPFPIPLTISEKVKTFHDVVEDMPEGSLILFNSACSVGGYPSVRAPTVAVARHLFERNMKLIFYASQLEGPVTYQILIDEISDIIQNKEYGVDYVFLGYIPGLETGIANVATDPKSAFPVDSKGTAWDSIPILKEYNDGADIDLCVVSTGATIDFEASIRQFNAAFGTPVAMIIYAMMAPSAEPYYPSQSVGLIYGPRHGAEYESLINKPATGSAQMGVQSVVHLLIALLLATGNVMYWIKRSRGEI
jgi:hypothetical protein